MANNSIRLQAKLKDGITHVKSLMQHPMETGTHKDSETGQLIPAYFIEEISCEHAGKVVMSAIWGVGISQNPFLSFKFKGGKIGDKIKMQWKDTQGETDSVETEIAEG